MFGRFRGRQNPGISPPESFEVRTQRLVDSVNFITSGNNGGPDKIVIGETKRPTKGEITLVVDRGSPRNMHHVYGTRDGGLHIDSEIFPGGPSFLRRRTILGGVCDVEDTPLSQAMFFTVPSISVVGGAVRSFMSQNPVNLAELPQALGCEPTEVERILGSLSPPDMRSMRIVDKVLQIAAQVPCQVGEVTLKYIMSGEV
ncbi:hypothetical protein IPL85_03440 [Candidatus Saccharibacteria bacterium]|nr:MAG: hypothetical protein IPL85_03440 [Candidatus Saccharibacteria bacterium]